MGFSWCGPSDLIMTNGAPRAIVALVAEAILFEIFDYGLHISRGPIK